MRILTTVLAIAGLGIITACSSTGTTAGGGGGGTTAVEARAFQAPTVAQTGKAARAQVYMLRGGFGDLFSSGINDMAEDLRAQGIPAHALSWTNEKTVLAAIEKAYAENGSGPIILVGHSLGAGASLRISRTLTEDGIPVDLVIAMDALGTPRVSKGVRRFISYKASGDKDNPGDFKGAPGFDGRIVNVDIRNLPDLEAAGHWSMVQQEALQERVMRDIVDAYQAG